MIVLPFQEKLGTRLRAIGRALQHRNFRLFFAGQSISLIGTWMQRLALGWLVYRLTNSAFLLGVVGFCGQIPTLIVGPFAGVLADRLNKHRLLIATQVFAMLQALILATLVLTGVVHIWHVIVLSLLLGAINAFDMPTRQSFMVQMVDDRADLGNAIALNSSMVNAARLIGPSIAGLLIAAVGEGICFLINGLSYLAVIVSLWMMRPGDAAPRKVKSKVWNELKDGLSYAVGFEPIRAILLLIAVVSLLGMPYIVLMPVFARDILHGGPDALGFLMGASGVGALVGAVYLASKRTVLGLGRLIPIASGVLGVGLAAFSFSRTMALSLPLMLFVGFGQMVLLAGGNTVLQTIVEDDKRGRVMSLFAIAFMGITPLGSLIAGAVASHIGTPWTVAVGGVACVAGGIAFLYRLPILRKSVRPIYVRMGIIPEIALGIQSASDTTLRTGIEK